MSRSFDIAIAGGGPGGSITGLCLARLGRRVAIVEASDFAEDRPGETLPPEINPLLRELGLWQSFRSCEPVESPGVVSVWPGAKARETDFAFHPYGCGWHIDRRRFDRMLLEAASDAGASVFTGKKAVITKNIDGWTVGREGEAELHAEFAVDATGREACRMDDSREREVEDRLVATVMRCLYAGLAPCDLRTFIEATPDGWWYSACLPANGQIAMFFTGAESYRRGEAFLMEQLSYAPFTRKRMQVESAHRRTTVVSVASSCRRRITGERWLAVGDSASSFDPLSGRGIFKAMKQGMAAGSAIDLALRGEMTARDQYAEKVRREFDSYVVQKRAFYASQDRWPQRPFWRARARAMKANAA